MRLLVTFLCSLAVFIFPGQACGYNFDSSTSFSRGSQDQTENRYFFWEVSSGQNKAYILGSIHVAKKDIYPLSSNLETVFEEADFLAVEVDLTQVNELELAAAMIDKAVYRDGGSLRQRLPPKTYQLAAEKMGQMNMDIRMFNMYQPWFLAVTLTSYALLELGFSPDWGIDQYFMNKAKDSGKKIVEMETFEYQISLFSELSDELQELFLLSTLSDLETIEENIDVIFQVWKQGNKRRLKTILKRGLRQYPQLRPFYDSVFVQRNKNMARQIVRYLDSGDSYFVVVGAGHLVGQQGIIQILRDKGYNLRQR